ncbi:hypothetical protein M8C21_000420, partial [Ambrosia artemisiifolia]
CFESAILLAIAILSIELPHDHTNSHTLEGYNFQADFWNLELMRHFFANVKMFLVDDTPSGVHTNLEHICIPYSKDQAMGVYSSVWRRVKTERAHTRLVSCRRLKSKRSCSCSIGLAGSCTNRARLMLHFVPKPMAQNNLSHDTYQAG